MRRTGILAIERGGGDDLRHVPAARRSQPPVPRPWSATGRLAVVRDVPVEVCENCGEVYLDTAVARQLDVLFRRLLEGLVDQVVGHYEPSAA